MTRIKLQLVIHRLFICLFYYILFSLVYCPLSYGNLMRQNQKITITAKDIPLEEVFNQIKQQTGITIINNFHETRLSNEKRVTVNFNKTDIFNVMSFLLNDAKELNFILKDESIIIFKGGSSIKGRGLRGNRPDTVSSTFQLSGRVVDVSGNPIPGATVKVKAGKHGTISNADGNFHLLDIEKGTVVVISSIGFESVEINADDKIVLVRMKAQTNNLDEKVVIAYGSTTRRLNTGNISSVKAKDIEKQPISNPILSLQGRVPGVVIQQTSGLPGSGITIHIQGLNSLRSGNDPFYLIDGVPYISQLLPAVNVSPGTSGIYNVPGNPLNFLNPSDIESIEILKDADATAIYGSRAANGAVLITTKKGKSGETKTDVTLQKGWGKVAHMLDLLDTKDYLNMRHEALKNDGITTLSDYDWDLNDSWDTTRNVDWQRELIGNTAQYSDAQVSVSGGNTLTQFLIGVGYNRQTTVFPGNYSDTKGSLHFNINNTSSNKKFKARLSASYMFDKNIAPMADITSSAITLPPVAPDPYNSDGSINWAPKPSGATTYYYNPLAPLLNTNSNKVNNLTSNLVFSYEIIPGLEIKSSMGYNNFISNELTKSPLESSSPEAVIYTYRTSTFITSKIVSWLVEPQIEYNRNISKGKFNFLLGSTISQNNNDQSWINAIGFSNDLVMEDLASATTLVASNINSIYKYNAIYSRMTYNWMDKYIINLNARRDGSSRFGPKNQFHNFASVGAAWIFSQEPFLQNALPFLSFGKLRGSYGTTGNDQIGDYLFLDLYAPRTFLGTLYQNSIGLTAQRLTNPYLQWEETRKLQFGLELGFIQDRILFSVNYNQNRSSNQLFPFSLPITSGFTSITKNFPAVVQNTGWEFTFSSNNIRTRNFTWTSSINLTIPKNQLLSFEGGDDYTALRVGRSISMVNLFSFGRLNEETGQYEFIDAKGDLTPQPSDPIDKTSIINPDPKFYGGFQNSFSFKGISMDILLQFCKQIAPDNLTYGMLGYNYPGTFNFGQSNQSTDVLDRWQKVGDKATYQPFSSDGSKSLRQIQNSDANWTDASYIKLKNLSISWQAPEYWRKMLHFQNLRLFMNTQNLFTVSKYKGFDPERPGLSLPPLRVITFGIQVTL